jgi:hypothetical protein
MAAKNTYRRRGKCQICWQRTQLRCLEALKPARRPHIIEWQRVWMCGWCAAIALSDAIGMEIPN